MLILSRATVLLCTLWERIAYNWFHIVYCSIVILPRVFYTGIVNIVVPD